MISFEEFRQLIPGDMIEYVYNAFRPIGALPGDEGNEIWYYLVLNEPYMHTSGRNTAWVVPVMHMKTQNKTMLNFSRQNMTIVRITSPTDDT